MANLVKWITEQMKEDEIEGVVIGEGEVNHKERGDPPIGVLITWKEAKPFLDYEFNSGFGGADCDPIYLWTKDRVYFIREYDGSTRLLSIPRNPITCMPDYQ